MTDIKQEIIKVFGDKLRVRVSGICIQGDQILLIKHHSLGTEGFFWSPPGGGMNFGESAEESLQREFLEETGLKVEIVKFLFVHEYLDPPLHAIELFFEVKILSGDITQGTDPEMDVNKQIIHDVKFLSFKEITQQPPKAIHQIFTLASNMNEILTLNGYYKHKNSMNKV